MSNFFSQHAYGTNQNQTSLSALQEDLAQKNAMIAQLLQRVEAMEVSTSTSTPQNKKKAKNKTVTPGSTQQPAASKSTSAEKAKHQTSPKTPKTPVSQRARSTTPATPSSATKKNPLQMVTTEAPEGFERTKEAFFLHIKVLWGLIEAGAVPTPPDSDQLREFNQRFSNSDQIKNAINTRSGPPLIALEQIETLRQAKATRKKMGKNIFHMSEMLIQYIHTSLARIGIRKWAPDLDAQPDSLYNEACRISAIRTFRQAVAGKAYTYMNINETFVNDLDLLIQTYDHYVHYYMASIYSKEKKEIGKHHRDEEKKVIQRARGRLCDARYKFAVNNNFSKRYLSIIKPVQAHSDDEYDPKKKVYFIKKLPFRSDAANKFFRRLDKVMQKENEDNGVRDQSRRRVRIKEPKTTLFPKAPKGLPIDFYDPEWFNEKLPAQKRTIANVEVVAFLPNPDDSFRPKQPAERLSDKKFSDMFWEKSTKKYDLDFLLPNESDSESENPDDDSDYGESIDLDYTSGSEDDEDDDVSEDDQDTEEDRGKGKGKGKQKGDDSDVDEHYSEFDEEDEDAIMQTADNGEGQSSYMGGMSTNEWNQWQ